MATPSAASKIEITAIASASHSTRLVSLPMMPSSRRCLISSGLTTTSAGVDHDEERGTTTISERCGSAKPDDAADGVAGDLLLDHGPVATCANRAWPRDSCRSWRPLPCSWLSVSAISDKIAEPTYLRLALGQPLRLEVALPRAAAAAPWSRVRRPCCWRVSGLDQVRGRRVQLVARYDDGGDAQLHGPRRPRRTSRWRRSPAPASRPTSSTSGFVPARSGTRPSDGSFMQNLHVVGHAPAGRRRARAGSRRRSRSRAPPRPTTMRGSAQPGEALAGSRRSSRAIFVVARPASGRPPSPRRRPPRGLSSRRSRPAEKRVPGALDDHDPDLVGRATARSRRSVCHIARRLAVARARACPA